MSVLADALTTTRFVFVLIILRIGLRQGTEGLPAVAALTVLCWITDVLDGPLARRSSRPTHLGPYDVVADLGLTLALATCLAVWGVLPLVLVAGLLAIAGLSACALHSPAPLQLAMGLVYGALILAACKIAPKWGRVLAGGVGLVVLLNPARARQQVVGFLSQVAMLFGGTQSGSAPLDHRAEG